jgi:hypothetical protein
LTRSRGKTKWLALIDLDEFIVPVCEYNVIDVLEKHYPHVTGLCINWQMYGTSNIYEIKENESMLQNLMYKMPTNHSTNFKFKSIVRPNFVVNCNNPHFCNYNFPHYHVNANLEKIIIENTGVYIDKIRLNHYWTRDEKYLNEVKIPRAKKWGVLTEENIRKGSIEMNQEEDRIMERFMNKE